MVATGTKDESSDISELALGISKTTRDKGERVSPNNGSDVPSPIGADVQRRAARRLEVSRSEVGRQWRRHSKIWTVITIIVAIVKGWEARKGKQQSDTFESGNPEDTAAHPRC